jgi:NADP-dependent 3-hydroxy acid dehydrogenase YdfG
VAETQAKGFPGKLVPFKCDLSNETDIDDLFKYIEANHGGVDVCVNNAGFASKETLLELNATQMRSMLDVNVVGLVLCASKSANSMLARGVNDGHIFNINSMSGHRLTGMLNFYSATKFAVTALTEGLRRELVARSRIRVTQISPGLVETEFAPRAFGAEKGQQLYEARTNKLQAEDLVDALIYALGAPERTQVHDILIRPTGDLV